MRRSIMLALALALVADATPALAIGNGPKGPCSGPPCPTAHKLPTPRAEALCKHGKPCGHSCIPRNEVCHVPPKGTGSGSSGARKNAPR
jgi:hypothetical protein